MVLTVHELKVDQTAIPSGAEYILISNFNVPDRFLDGDLLRQQRVLERIRAVIVDDYRGVREVQYQLTATYQLRHAETGATRQWAGSFMPGGNQRSALSNFQNFGPDFTERVRQYCDRETALRGLRFYNVDTKWEIDHLTSLIINVQAIVPGAHPTLTRRNIRNGGRRHHRNHVTFPLP